MATFSSTLTWRFDAALQLASALHHKQKRKGTETPYIAHLLGVCALVLESGGDEDQAIAALLHDAVEDQGGLPTLETIRHLFGNRVAEAVESCSDSTVSNPALKAPWRERKEKYLAHLRSANQDALLVGISDKLYNVGRILLDYREIGDNVWRRFSVSKEEQLWYYGMLVKTFRETPAPRNLVEELGRAVDKLKKCGE